MSFNRHIFHSRVINDLKGRSLVGIVLYPLITSIVLFADDYYVRHPDFSNRFMMLISVISVFRAIHIFVSKLTGKRFEQLNKLIFFGSVLLTALIWGVGFAKFMVQTGEESAKLLMVMCTVGLASGAMVAYIPEKLLAIFSGILLIMPAGLAMFFQQMNYSLVILMIIYVCYMSSVIVRGNKEYWIALENEYRLAEKTRDLQCLSRTDSLTGLFNRRYFDELFNFEWQRAVRQQTPIAIILADIDYFKSINDRYGHPGGDEYLKSISGVFRQVFKRTTDVIARYGGEEFIIMMPDESIENVEALAENLRDAVRRMKVPVDERQIQTTISIGVAVGHAVAGREGQDGLISLADKALYKSKQDGRDQVTTICPQA